MLKFATGIAWYTTMLKIECLGKRTMNRKARLIKQGKKSLKTRVLDIVSATSGEPHPVA